MTAYPEPAGRLLTVAEYLVLPETDERFELQAGSLALSPGPKSRHPATSPASSAVPTPRR